MIGEDTRHCAGESLTVDRPAGVRHLIKDLLQAFDDPREEFPGYLTGSVDRTENFLGLPMQTATQLGHLIPRPGPVIRGDGRHPRLTDRTHQIPPLDQRTGMTSLVRRSHDRGPDPVASCTIRLGPRRIPVHQLPAEAE